MRYGDTNLAKIWRDRKESYESARSTGIVLVYVYSNKRIRVVAPYDKDWLNKAHELGGRWRKRTKSWTFGTLVIKPVLNALIYIYGGSRVKVVDCRHTAL